MFTRFPKQLPSFLALICGLIPITYIFIGLEYETKFGRPSSTSAIGYFFAPIYGLILSGVGYLFGMFLRAIWIRLTASEPTPHASRISSSVILILSIILPAILSVTSVSRYIKNTQPAILVDMGIFKYSPKALPGQKVRTSTLLSDGYSKISNPIKWNNTESKILNSGSGYSIADINTGKTLSIPTTGLDYITAIYAVQLNVSHEKNPILALVISGRATGRRAILLAMSCDYKMLYAERLDRFWDLDDNPLAVFLDKESNVELGMLGSAKNGRVFILSKAA